MTKVSVAKWTNDDQKEGGDMIFIRKASDKNQAVSNSALSDHPV
jgi:hypothetical protein